MLSAALPDLSLHWFGEKGASISNILRVRAFLLSKISSYARCAAHHCFTGAKGSFVWLNGLGLACGGLLARSYADFVFYYI